MVGDVAVWHTREDLSVEVIPGTDQNGNPFMIKEVSIVTANSPGDSRRSA